MAVPTISKANTSISTAERKRIPMCGGCEVISPLPLLNWPGIRPSTVAETLDLQSWLIRTRGVFPTWCGAVETDAVGLMKYNVR